MKTLSILLLATALVCHSQTSPTIKGHTLGETTQEFTDHADDITRGLISTCVTKSRAYPALKAAADAAKAAYAPHAHDTRATRAGKAAYDAWAADGNAAAAHDADPSREIGCEGFMTIVNTGNGLLYCTGPVDKAGMCRNFEGLVRFVSGKVVEYRIEIWHTSWDDALGDTVAKFGKPEETHTSTMQNGYGAKFDIQTASWTTPIYMADLCEVINGHLNRYSSLHLVDRAYYDNEHKPHGSVLD